MNGVRLFRFSARARGRVPCLMGALASCLVAATPLSADTGAFDVSIASYVARMVIALLLLMGVGYMATRLLPGRLRRSDDGGRIRLIGSLWVGRDLLHVVRIGPEVFAFVAGKAGVTLLGSWSADAWDEEVQ